MTPLELYISFKAILRKEVWRILRIWWQTFLPPIVTTTLYFIVFWVLLGKRIADIHSVPYVTFIAPWLVMMSVLMNAYSNVTSSFYGEKFQRTIDEMLVSPMPACVIISGYVSGGIFRWMSTGLLVLLVARFFTSIPIHSPFSIIAFALLTSAIFSIAWLINAVYAKNFDSVAIVPTFILTPLTYLWGIFYSIDLLPEPWKTLSFFNPILYVVNGFRYGFFGTSDVSVNLSYSVLLGALVVALIWCVFVFKSGKWLKP